MNNDDLLIICSLVSQFQIQKNANDNITEKRPVI